MIKIINILMLMLIIPIAHAAVNHASCLQMSKWLSTELHIKTKSTIVEDKNTCTITFKGTGEQFESKQYPTLAQMRDGLDKKLKAKGWAYTEKAKSYDADAPFSTQFAREKDGTLMVVSMEAEELVKGKCPEDQPMDLYGNCKLTSKERSYVVSVKMDD